MEQELTIRLRLGPLATAVEERPRSVAALGLPLLGSLLQTYGVVSFACATPWAHTLRLPGLVGRAVLWLAVTMGAHSLAVWSNRLIFRRQVDAPARFLILATWPAVVWVPLLVLLKREGSVLVALVPLGIAASAAMLLRRWTQAAEGGPRDGVDAGEIRSVFRVERPRSMVRAMAPAVLTSIALQAAMAGFGAGRPLAAGWLLAAGTVFPVWVFPLRLKPLRPEGDLRSLTGAVLPRTLLVFLLLAVALAPYLRSGGGVLAALNARLRAGLPVRPATSPSGQAAAHAPAGSYSGVILVLPAKPHRAVVPPAPPVPAPLSTRRSEPVRIVFDGSYWYFKQPDRRPRADAPVVRGDPRERSIRSTDTRPLSMEAHQRLAAPMGMSCCRALRVAVQNADVSPGAIWVEVQLRDRASEQGAAESLGVRPLQSSEQAHIPPDRAPVDEVLTFPFPRRAGERRFDEITVVIRSARERARTGPHVAVQSFELVP
jgi:hypothetical protein